MSKRKKLALAFAAVVIALPVGRASADSGDFIGGMIGGFILKTFVDSSGGPGKQRSNARPTHGSRQDPEVTNYWKAVQGALNESGFDAGQVDGIAGRRTREAVRNFQKSIGEEPDGKLTGPQHQALMKLANMNASNSNQFTEPENWDTEPDKSDNLSSYRQLFDEDVTP